MAVSADRVLLSNDSGSSGGGIHGDDQQFNYFPYANITSSIGAASAVTLQPLFIAKSNGRIVDAGVGLAQFPVSASGFVSGAATMQVRINSAAALSTQPLVPSQAASAANNYLASNQSGTGVVSAVVNAASGAFSQGNLITVDWQTYSAGSAAAGVAGSGLGVWVTARYAAN